MNRNSYDCPYVAVYLF